MIMIGPSLTELASQKPKIFKSALSRIQMVSAQCQPQSAGLGIWDSGIGTRAWQYLFHHLEDLMCHCRAENLQSTEKYF